MKVFLVGAGPGDEGLLTLRGKQAIELADVLVYDFLANSAFLRYARPDAEIIYVGKKGNQHTLPQEDINQLIIAKAKEGKIVTRLKGGDPYIFGRGGEEAEELVDAGVPFETVPGVTSAVAGPAHAGIPLTHRSFASSVSFITGHEDPTKPDSAHNWGALAASASTLVFFMGMKNLPEIAEKLINAGMDKDMPAALVHWGTTPRHRSLVATLSTLYQEGQKLGFTNPSLIVVGKVVQLHDKLNWFEKKPLLGKGIVVTRAREQASDSAALLAEQGADVLQFPTIAIKALPEKGTEMDAVRHAIDTLSSYQWVVFTSVNGVRHFWNSLNAQGKDSRALAQSKIAAIGPATAQALQEKGIHPDCIPDTYVAESVVASMRAAGVQGVRILIPRAREAREVLPEELRAAGAQVDVLPIYETVPATERREEILERLENGSIHCVTFGSSSTVENFLAQIPVEVLKKYPQVKLACIGPVTAKTLRAHGLDCTIQPVHYTIPALVEALCAEL